MGFYRKWTPSKTAKREFAEKMDEIDRFCSKNGIVRSASGDSCYFALDGVRYRVSNHTMKRSNEGTHTNVFGERVKNDYHSEEEISSTVEITASKTRIVQIYTDLKGGRRLDKRGCRVEESEKGGK